jgi:hypothetical protein
MIHVCIPTYLQQGYGPDHLRALLESIKMQRGTFVVQVADGDDTGQIKAVCDEYAFVNHHFSHAYTAHDNINAAIALGGPRIKLMMMDDLLLTPDALQRFDKALDTHGWVVSGSRYINSRGKIRGSSRAYYNPDKFDKNYTGMPSVIGFIKCDARMDGSLKTFVDLDFYRQLYNIYGPPALIQSALIGQRYHPASLSRNQVGEHEKEAKILYERYKS